MQDFGENIAGKLLNLQRFRLYCAGGVQSDGDLLTIGWKILLNIPNLKALDLSCDRLTSYIFIFLTLIAISSKGLLRLDTNSSGLRF